MPRRVAEGIAADEAEKGGVRCRGESGCEIARQQVSVMDVIDGVRDLLQRAAALRQQMIDERLRDRANTAEVGDDAPDVRDWNWPGAPPPGDAAADAQRGQRD